ncbi:hypothetical protein V8F33_012517 [Rhypophila sp. PSN 637]
MSGDRLYAGVETEAEAEADECENFGQLVTWLESLEIKTVEPPTGIEPNLEEDTHSPKGGLSKSRRRRRRRKKTEFQKEYNQISQRERRREKRRAKRAEKGDKNTEDDTSDFSMLWMIYVAHDRDGSLRKKFPKSVDVSIEGTDTERVVRNYMQRHEEGVGIEVSTFVELVDYAAIKRNEVISLRRRLNVLERTEKHYDEKLRAIGPKMDGLAKGSTERPHGLLKERFSAIHKLAVVRHAAVVLPLLIKRAAEQLEELNVKLNQGREVDMEWLKVNDLRRDLDDEKGKAQLLAKWVSKVFPLSGTYNEIVERFEKAEARARELENEYTLAMEGLEGKMAALLED